MKYNLTTPCAQCPLRNDIVPFISAARVQEILDLDAEFPCHKTVDYSSDPQGRVKDDSQHCAGVLIIREKEERPSQMMRICERLGLYDRSKLRMEAPVYEDTGAAVRAHRVAGRR